MGNLINEEILIANAIREIRKQKHFTQEYLAAKLHISQNAYSKIELGYTCLTVQRLFNILTVLEMNIFDLLVVAFAEPESTATRPGKNI